MKINTKNLLALCHIIDEYPQFREDLEPFVEKTNNYYNNISKFVSLTNSKRIIGGKKEKQIYNKNKEIFDKINRYSYISNFLLEIEDIDNFYNYLNEYRENLNKITLVVTKITDLGIKTINLDLSQDFTKENYQLDTSTNIPFRKFDFVDNIKIIPNYESEIVKYTTTNSPYQIKIQIDAFLYDPEIHVTDMTLNTLVFDANTLPKELTMEETFNKIKYLNSLSQENHQVQNSVNLLVGVNDLEKQVKKLEQELHYNSLLTSKVEIQKILLNMKKCLLQLKQESENYIESITKDNGIVTPELIKEEKEAYLNRRFYRGIDFD